MIHKQSPIYKELKQAHEKIKNLKKKVMITHEPPLGSKIELLGFPGSEGVRKAIDKFKPDILICGHIHEGGGLIEQIGKTKVMNVSRTPTIFEI
jgi:Icc-related predicted phosphoesterase